MKDRSIMLFVIFITSNNHIKMIQLLIIISIILISAFIYYSFVIKPKKIISFYKKQFQKLDFKVFDYPFLAFKYAQFEAGLKSQQKTRDTMGFVKEVTSEFDVSITNIAQKVAINLISPILMQAFFESDQQKYYQKEELFIEGLRRTFGDGITMINGNPWKHKRRIVTKMLNFNYIKILVPKIESIIERKTKEMLKQINKNQDKQFHEFDLLQLTTTIKSTVILELFFGGSQFDVNQLKINGILINHFVRELFELLLKQLISPLTIILGPRFTKLGLRKNDRQLNRYIEMFQSFGRQFICKRVEELKEYYKVQRPEPEVYTDLIQAFYYEQIVKNKQEVTTDFINALIHDFGHLYAAGTDTTSHNAQAALYFVISNPKVYEKLQSQILLNIKDIKNLSYDDFKNCTYLQAVVLESLRMYVTANGIFPRVAKEDHYLKVGQQNILITKGTILNTQTFPVHYKEKIYSSPNEFKPQRFLDSFGKIISPQPYTWLPFSAGPRSCVGRQLALTQIKSFLITMISQYEFKCDDSNKLLYFKQFSYNIANVKFEIRKRQSESAQ